MGCPLQLCQQLLLEGGDLLPQPFDHLRGTAGAPRRRQQVVHLADDGAQLGMGR